MGGQEHGPPLTGVGDQLAEPHALFGVQADGRLVEDEERGVADQGGGQRGPLARPAGQLPQPLSAYVGEPDLVQYAPHLAVPGGAVGELLEDRHVVDELEGGEVGMEPGGLRQVAETAPDLLTAARGTGCVSPTRG